MAAPSPTPPPQWALDLNTTSTTTATPSTSTSKSKTPPSDPPGYTPTTTLTRKERAAQNAQAAKSTRKPPTPEEMETLKMKKAWEIAIAPAKQVPMNAIGIYMTGSTLQIFSLFMLVTLFKTPLLAIVGLQRTFAPYETAETRARLLPVKAVYVLMNLLMMGLGVWKVNTMGLLPTTRSDWLGWEAEREWGVRGVDGGVV